MSGAGTKPDSGIISFSKSKTEQHRFMEVMAMKINPKDTIVLIQLWIEGSKILISVFSRTEY